MICAAPAAAAAVAAAAAPVPALAFVRALALVISRGLQTVNPYSPLFRVLLPSGCNAVKNLRSV